MYIISIRNTQAVYTQINRLADRETIANNVIIATINANATKGEQVINCWYIVKRSQCGVKLRSFV